MKVLGWTPRQLYVFFALEILLAGLLVLLDVFIGGALIIVGLTMVVGLWVVDNRPNWVPAFVRSRMGIEAADAATERPPLTLDFPQEINSDARYGPNKVSTAYYLTGEQEPHRVTVSEYFISVTNCSERTIRNVSVVVQLIENPIPDLINKRLRTSDGKTVFDLVPGYTEYVKLGVLFRTDENALGRPTVIDRAEFERIEPRWNAFALVDPGFIMEFDGEFGLPFLRNDNLRLRMGLYGDDVPPSHHQFIMHCKGRFELHYEGLVNPDEPLVPRSQLSTATRTPPKSRPD